MASFSGTNGADTYDGTPDYDGIEGNGGDDRLNGAGGDDSIVGGTGADRLYGGDGNDRLADGAVPITGNDGAADSLYGEGGSDTIIAHAFDVADGGADYDSLWLLLGDRTFGITADFTTMRSGTLIVAGTYLAGFETLQYLELTQYDDTVTLLGDGVGGGTGTGYIAPDTIVYGFGGNDRITGSANRDYIVGGSGGDALTGGDGDDTLFESEFDAIDTAADTLDGGAGDDRLFVAYLDSADGGDGIDTVQLQYRAATTAIIAAFDTLGRGGSVTVGSATLAGIERISALDLSDFDDVVSLLGNGGAGTAANAWAGDDRITGSDAADAIDGGDGDDAIDGGEGDDSLTTYGGGTVLVGGAGDDSLVSNGGGDTEGGSGNDTVALGGTGSVAGGNGFDTLLIDYSGLDGGVTANLRGLSHGGVVRVGSDRLSGIELLTSLRLTEFADNVRLPTAGTTELVSLGGGGGDRITGSAGWDRIAGGDGDDVLIGGGTIAGQIDHLDGGSGDDRLTGGAGSDELNGGGDDDVLDGGGGADTLIGDGGDDLYLVDSMEDVVVEVPFAGIDTVRTALASYTLASGVEKLTFTGTGDFRGTGNAFDNVLIAGAGDDILAGGAGIDVLNGGGGDDVMVGGAGDDTYRIDSAGDVIVELANEGVDTVSVTLAGYVLGADLENLTLAGTGDGAATGNAAANVLTGAAGDDRLDGAAGADTLIGGAGADALTGGTGADVFRFADGETGRVRADADRIVDFSHAEGDRIDLSGLDGIAGTAAIDRFVFVGTSAYSGQAGELRYDQVARATIVSGDTDGDGVGDVFIRLDGMIALTAADFGLSAGAAIADDGEAAGVHDWAFADRGIFGIVPDLP